jgi:flagellar basal body-associated protein FliL
MDGEEFSTKHSAEFKMKILKRVKELTNYGKHKEAEELFKIYFTNFSKLGEQNGKN